MADPTTTPVELTDPASPVNVRNEQGDETIGAFSSAFSDRVLGSRIPQSSFDPEVVRSQAANMSGQETVTPARPVDVRDPPPVATKQPSLGKRGFVAAYQWEGVVEAVGPGGFRARLRPFEGGFPSRTQIEYADFDLDDLADESDVALVVEGGIFYWTVGKSRNTAGTYTNTSLVRFRRVPAGGRASASRALAAADALLKDLGETPST